MSRNSTTKFDKMKHEVARELNIDLKDGYNGDLTARDSGLIGGNIVKRVFENYTGKNYKG